MHNDNSSKALLLIGKGACLQPEIKRWLATGELRNVMSGGEWFWA